MPITLSSHLGVSPAAIEAQGVFDAFIDLDSQLHVDPHLLEDSDSPEMQDAAVVLKEYFADIITLLAAADEMKGPLWDAARNKLELNELKGVSLGYSKGDSDGSAVGPGLARVLAQRAFTIVKAGETNPRIFELVGLFTDDFGADRISDVVLRIAHRSFAKYTMRVASSLGVATQPVVVAGATYALPVQSRQGKARPLIFVPQDVLRELPVALDVSEIASVASRNTAIRSEINALFASVSKGRRPAKGDLWERVLAKPQLVAALLQAYAAATGGAYDFHLDPAAESRRFKIARELANQFPLPLSKPASGWTGAEALGAVVAICNHFRALVEANGLWDALWIRKTPPVRSLTERAMQRIFFGVALTYCREGTPDLDIAPETNAGPGPVDFKFSHGSAARVTVEMKKSNHDRLVRGYSTQLALYNEAERTTESVFLVIRVSDDDRRINEIRRLRRETRARGEHAPEIIVIDARPRDSASKA